MRKKERTTEKKTRKRGKLKRKFGWGGGGDRAFGLETFLLNDKARRSFTSKLGRKREREQKEKTGRKKKKRRKHSTSIAP